MLIARGNSSCVNYLFTKIQGIEILDKSRRKKQEERREEGGGGGGGGDEVGGVVGGVWGFLNGGFLKEKKF